MIASFQLSKVLILLTASCLLWTALLALGAAYFFGATAGTAWIVASALSVALVLGVAVMANEFRCAISLPDSFDDEAQWQAAGAKANLPNGRKRLVFRSVPGERQILRQRAMTPTFCSRSPLRLRLRKPSAIRRKARPRRTCVR